LANKDIDKLEQNYNMILLQSGQIDKFIDFLDKLTREMFKSKLTEKIKIYGMCKINLDSFNSQFKLDVKNIKSIQDVCKASFECVAKSFGFTSHWKNLNKFLNIKSELINEIKRRRIIIVEKYTSLLLKHIRKSNFEKKVIKTNQHIIKRTGKHSYIGLHN